MSADWKTIPPGHVWILVDDLTTSMLAFEILARHIVEFNGPTASNDHDEI